MPGNRDCTVYVGNLDERVSERVLYEILVQAGKVLDVHVPRDKETNQHRGVAFVEYETEEIADYAVKLFSSLVTLHNRTLKFGISGKKESSKLDMSRKQVTPSSSSIHISRKLSCRNSGSAHDAYHTHKPSVNGNHTDNSNKLLRRDSAYDSYHTRKPSALGFHKKRSFRNVAYHPYHEHKPSSLGRAHRSGYGNRRRLRNPDGLHLR